MVGLTPMPSEADMKALVNKARRVNSLRVAVPPDATLKVDASVTKKVTQLLRNEYGQEILVSIQVSIPRKSQKTLSEQDALKSEVGRLVMDENVATGKVKVARVNVDQDSHQGVDLDLFQEQVAARVAVLLGTRGAFVDRFCHDALTEAWSQASDRVSTAVASEQ